MIDSITIKNVATYDSVGIQISDLKKVNFIYGSNGSGKTTITKYIDKPNENMFRNCTLVWKNGLAIKALIYNKDFRDRNFGKGTVEGIFTLGKETKEYIEAIKKMQDDLEEIKDKGVKKRETLDTQIKEKEKLENDFKEAAWFEIYKKFEKEFKEAFLGVQTKELLKSKVISEFTNNKSALNTHDELIEKAKTIFGKIPTHISPIVTIDCGRLVEIEDETIWQKKIIGKADIEIAKLIQSLNLNDWVNEGRTYLDGNICPFCQQATISDDFKIQLEQYFDQSYTLNIAKLKANNEEYNLLSLNVINLLQQIEAQEKVNADTKLNIELFSAYCHTLVSQFISNRELLNNKIKEPSRSIDLIKIKGQLENIQTLIQNANDEIKKHNNIVSNYADEKNKLIKAVWKFLIEENRIKIESFNNQLNGLNNGISALEIQRRELLSNHTILNEKIKAANKNVTSIQPSVDEINRVLKSYGFLNFEIVPSKIEKNQYQIHRQDGTIAESTLSEGEITFITFLYFLQLAKGSTFQELISEARILVIDDPISSLDSNVLFVVSSLIKEIIKDIRDGKGNIKQLILLTHNVYFHKEVSFIDGRTFQKADTFYWILRKNYDNSTIQAFEMKNPISNSYELLWSELKNWEKNSGITIHNTMRRIIENYFKLLGKNVNDALLAKFDNHQEQQICRSLLCWINDGSHSLPDDLFIERQDSTIEKYLQVFKQIFEHTNHIEHYKMMMGEQDN